MLRKYLLPIFFVSLFISCSSSESISDDLLTEMDNQNYFPLEKSNYWVYEVDSDTSGIDSLWIAKDTLIEGQIYHHANANNPKLGFVTNLLDNSLLHKSKSKLILNGAISELLPEVKIPVENLVLLDPKNPVGNDMFKSTGTFSIEKQGYTIELAYTITTKTEAFIKDYSLFDEDYSNVIKTSIIVNLSGVVIATIDGFEVIVPVLKPQDAIISTLYFAPNIGIINSETNIAYQLTNIDQLSIPIEIPTNGSEIISQHISRSSKTDE